MGAGRSGRVRRVADFARWDSPGRTSRSTSTCPGGEVTGSERHGDGHGFEVAGPGPAACCCETCRTEAPARLEGKDAVRVVRDLDILGPPSFWAYQAVAHRCPHCGHRQDLVPPFQCKDVADTYRFEAHALRLLIGSTEEEVARRLGISAETVAGIVKNQLADARAQSDGGGEGPAGGAVCQVTPAAGVP
jgi:hypothetical protein